MSEKCVSKSPNPVQNIQHLGHSEAIMMFAQPTMSARTPKMEEILKARGKDIEIHKN